MVIEVFLLLWKLSAYFRQCFFHFFFHSPSDSYSLVPQVVLAGDVDVDVVVVNVDVAARYLTLVSAIQIPMMKFATWAPLSQLLVMKVESCLAAASCEVVILKVILVWGHPYSLFWLWALGPYSFFFLLLLPLQSLLALVKQQFSCSLPAGGVSTNDITAFVSAAIVGYPQTTSQLVLLVASLTMCLC